MEDKFTSPYDPAATERRIYAAWEESGYFNPDQLPGERSEPFSMVLPPPNVTGTLHMGSALMIALEDLAIRFERMRGKKTLWLPGTDSAAIATQAKVEKDIQKAEGKNRHDLGRAELLERIGAFVESNKSTMLAQMRSMGASLDWSRYAYTMDEPRYRAVMEAFVRMYEAGLIYRGNRIVNWDPKGQTTISDDEIVYEERPATLYTFRYSKDFPIPVATTRPETKVGDVAVAVHPEDARYQEYVGKEYAATFCDVPITITVVADEAVDPAFGTGAVGVTPAHSFIDWDIATRHNLPKDQIVINEFAKMKVAGRLEGKKVLEAREAVVEWLRSEGLLEKEEAVKQSVATAERTSGVIEPLPKLQWWVAVEKPVASRGNKTLKELMLDPVKEKRIEIIPEHFDKTYFHWIENLRDWCISRQIWFGHRIPAWYQGEEMKVQIESPGAGWVQEEDVLDTWFSSGLWTLSTLGWPQETPDLKEYHPTALLETGYDILFFWIARMILMSQFLVGEIPFKKVYLHGLVRDKDGKKISKSLGNNIDPVEMGSKYGMDAVRMALVVGNTPGTDTRMDENKIKAYKHFANKLWNIARFILESTEGTDTGSVLDGGDQMLKDEFDALAADITRDLEDYRFYLAAEKIYHYVWHRLADEILEESKKIIGTKIAPSSAPDANKNSKKALLLHLLDGSVKLLHPFMPFVTEEIYQSLPTKDADLLMVAKWPI